MKIKRLLMCLAAVLMISEATSKVFADLVLDGTEDGERQGKKHSRLGQKFDATPFKKNKHKRYNDAYKAAYKGAFYAIDDVRIGKDTFDEAVAPKTRNDIFLKIYNKVRKEEKKRLSDEAEVKKQTKKQAEKEAVREMEEEIVALGKMGEDEEEPAKEMGAEKLPVVLGSLSKSLGELNGALEAIK